MRMSQQRKLTRDSLPVKSVPSTNRIDRIELDEFLAKLIQSNEVNLVRAEIDKLLQTYTPQDASRLIELSNKLASLI